MLPRRPPGQIIAGVAGGRGVPPVVSVVPVIFGRGVSWVRVVVVMPHVFLRGFVIVMVGVFNWTPLLGG